MLNAEAKASLTRIGVRRLLLDDDDDEEEEDAVVR
jgi:hypothetical protein